MIMYGLSAQHSWRFPTLRADAGDLAALVFALGVVVARLVDAQVDVLIAEGSTVTWSAAALHGVIDHFALPAVLTLDFAAVD